MTIGDRIKKLRTDRGWTQGHLAAQLQLAQSTVYRWESNRSEPRPAERQRLADLFDVSEDWLRTGRRGKGATKSPPHWQEFVERYEHLEAFSEAEIEDLKGFAARNLRPDSWVKWERLFEDVRTAKRRPPPGDA